MTDHLERPTENPESNDALTEAINKAEQVVEQYQAYLDASHDDSETEKHLRPSDEKLIDVFFQLESEVSTNIKNLEVDKFYKILQICHKLLEIFETLKITLADSPELFKYLNQIYVLLENRKKTGQLFEGKEGAA